MMKEIIAALSRIARAGTKMKTFEAVACRFNKNQRFKPHVNGRKISEQFKARIKTFISGVILTKLLRVWPISTVSVRHSWRKRSRK